MNPIVYIARTNMKVPYRRIPVYGYKLGTDYVMDFDVVCEGDTTEARLGCDQAGWLWVSDDAGSTYYEVTDDATTGFQFGPLLAGNRQAIKLKLAIPVGTSARRRFVALNFGIGDGSVTHIHWGDLFGAWESYSADNWEDIA